MDVKYPKSRTRRPIRKRGFHRAIKRGETWALSEKALSEAFKIAAENLAKAFFNPLVDNNINQNNVYMVGLSKWLPPTEE